jgi:hypothetical protein
MVCTVKNQIERLSIDRIHQYFSFDWSKKIDIMTTNCNHADVGVITHVNALTL